MSFKTWGVLCLFCFCILEPIAIQFSTLNELISYPIIEENDHLPPPYVDFGFKYHHLKVLKLIKLTGFSAHRLWHSEQKICRNIIWIFKIISKQVLFHFPLFQLSCSFPDLKKKKKMLLVIFTGFVILPGRLQSILLLLFHSFIFIQS